MRTASRKGALETLSAFLPKAGPEYTQTRNFDLGPQRHTTSLLSPYLQRRLLSEEEVIAAVLGKHSREGCYKFTQEVLWRSYWKSWLERRPSVWSSYLSTLHSCEEVFGTVAAARDEQFAMALQGATGVEAFDSWRRELAETGFLHNHARMWFASIWIYTLQLPWQLGAALFQSELLDADCASNTLSWRWVAGQQTLGKGYIATASNIARFTSGRFHPLGELNEAPQVRPEREAHILESVREGFGSEGPPRGRTGLLATSEDLSVDASALSTWPFASVACFAPTMALNVRKATSVVRCFETEALEDAEQRFRERWECSVHRVQDEAELRQWCKAEQLEAVVAVAPAMGFVRQFWTQGVESLGVPVWEARRSYDLALLPFATRGFFPFLDNAADILDRVEDRASPGEMLFRRRK